MIEEIVTRYMIKEKLGNRGMDEIYKNENLKLPIMIAQKFIPSELLCDEKAKTRFIYEAQAASSFQHNKICSIHDIEETEDGKFFMTENCISTHSSNAKANLLYDI